MEISLSDTMIEPKQSLNLDVINRCRHVNLVDKKIPHELVKPESVLPGGIYLYAIPVL